MIIRASLFPLFFETDGGTGSLGGSVLGPSGTWEPKSNPLEIREGDPPEPDPQEPADPWTEIVTVVAPRDPPSSQNYYGEIYLGAATDYYDEAEQRLHLYEDVVVVAPRDPPPPHWPAPPLTSAAPESLPTSGPSAHQGDSTRSVAETKINRIPLARIALDALKTAASSFIDPLQVNRSFFEDVSTLFLDKEASTASKSLAAASAVLSVIPLAGELKIVRRAVAPVVPLSRSFVRAPAFWFMGAGGTGGGLPALPKVAASHLTVAAELPALAPEVKGSLSAVAGQGGGGAVKGLTYSQGFEAGEQAAKAGEELVLGKFPANVNYVAKTPGTTTLDVAFGWTRMYNAGYIRGFMEEGGNIRQVTKKLSGTYEIEVKQVFTIPGEPPTIPGAP